MHKRVTRYRIGDSNIEYNVPQLLTILATQKNKYLEWGRGAGKSTVLADSLVSKPIQMPRGSFFLVGETYSQILTRTLPSTIAGLEKLGYYKDVHFFVGRKAPAKWKWLEPYQPPLNYDHAIHWITGAVTHLISLDLPNSGRGLNTDGGDGDEAALFDYEKLFNNVLTTIRGNIDRFGHCPLHQSTMFASSTPMTNKGKWLLKMEEQAKKDPQDIFYLRASAEYNRHNLGDNWFKENKRIMTPLIYNAEVLNIRPGKVEGGFYPAFNEDIHCITTHNNSYLLGLGWDMEKAKKSGCLADGDLQLDQPIDVSFDYGGKINTLVSEQTFGNESRFLKAMFKKSPDLIDELVNEFCKYYSGHKNKTVVYWRDHTSVGKYGTAKLSFAEMVIETFHKNGWQVEDKYMGLAPGHNSKYNFFYRFHKADDYNLPRPVYNAENCKYLIISIQHAGVREGKNGLEKDKRPEHYKNAVDEETTHFSDAHDTLAYFKYSYRINSSGGDFELP
jgi:hypothetical protein